MRICIPIHSFEPGGVERVGLRLAQCWQAAGHEVTIVLGRDRGPTRDQAPALHYARHDEPFSTARWETPWLIWCLWRYLRKHPAEVIFCAGNTYTIVCVAMKLLLGRRCPPVLAKISNDLVRRDFSTPVQALYRVWLRAQGKLLDRFVALAPPMLPQLVCELQIPGARAVAIPDPALDDGDFATPPTPARAARGGRRFLAVARLNRQKNLPLLLEAFASIARPHDKIMIAGEGPERRRIERAIANLGLENRVRLLGHVGDVRPLLENADVLVLSSDYEGVPAAVIEALAAGRAIAATDCCASMHWLLQDGAFGALAPVGDAAGLAEAMDQAWAMVPPQKAMRAFAAAFTLAKAAPAYLAEMQALRDQTASRQAVTNSANGDRAASC